MKFKEVRDFIFDTCCVIVGTTEELVQVHKETKYDDYEIEGIRSRFQEYHGITVSTWIEVVLKEPN